MDEAAFRRQLEQGRGGVIVWAQGHDVTPWREYILEACTHDLSKGHWWGNERGQYLFDLIQASGEAEFYRKEILIALGSPKQDEDNGQLGELARLFAETGDGDARRALYITFVREAMDGDFCNGCELVKLDGLDGLLFAMERLAAREDAEERWEFRSWVSDLEERDGKAAARETLDRAAAKQSDLARLLEAARRSQEQTQREIKERRAARLESYEDIRGLIEREGWRARVRLMHWGARAPDSELEAAAQDLLREQEADRLLAYLYIFQRRRFPLDPDRLLHLARADDETARRAMGALSHVTDPAVRALALERATEPKWFGEAVEMLSANYEEGDFELVEQMAEAPQDPDQYHGFGISVLHFAEAHPEPQSVRALTLVYENGPCAICRCSIVQDLLEMSALPDWMRAECRWDADLETRRLVQEGADVNDGHK